ncbi:hypothetical protein GQ457_01G024890 [Hibiscus cannabinus]
MGSDLGVPIRHSNANGELYNFLIDKIHRKLDGWSACSLSFTGCLTLIKSVLLSISSYIMQTCSFPSRICGKIEAFVRNFLWGSNITTPKIYLANWASLCQPSNCRGLGFRDLRSQNNVFLLKVCNSLVQNLDALWVRLLYEKNRMMSLCPFSISQANCSPFWRSLSRLWPNYIGNVAWSLGDGSIAWFWSDNWIPALDPLHLWARPEVVVYLTVRVRDMVLPDGS